MKKFLISIAAAVALLLVLCTAGGVALRCAYPATYRENVLEYYGDWRLVHSLIKAESSFRADAVSEAGACGLMQVLPSTAAFVARKNGIGSYDLGDAADNIRIGCLYLVYLEERFSDLNTVLAAYNAGEGTVRQWLDDPALSADGVRLTEIPYAETAKYVEKIQKYYSIYRKIYLTNESK